MSKNDFTTVELGKGEVRVYERAGLRLHAYQTRDLIDDEVFVIENNGRGFVLEYPCFFDNIAELEGYLSDAGIKIEGIVAAYHMAGATFLAGTPVYATREADEYGHTGGGRALIDGFTAAFGEAFDNSIPDVTNYIEGDVLTLAGVEMRIVRNAEAFDVVIPALNMVYTHMLGHDCHSIVAGTGHADGIIAQLEGYLAAGYDLVLTSHYTPEDLKDVETKIAYLRDLKAIAEGCADADSFKSEVQKRYPDYAGENYLDMTCDFFFPQK